MFVELIGLTAATIVVVLALWRGDCGTRAAGIALAVAWLVGLWTHFVPREAMPLVWLASDGLLASALLLIAIRYGSVWQGVSMLIQATAFGTHAWALSTDDHVSNVYFAAINILSAALLLSILTPTLINWRRRRIAQRRQAER